MTSLVFTVYLIHVIVTIIKDELTVGRWASKHCCFKSIIIGDRMVAAGAQTRLEAWHTSHTHSFIKQHYYLRAHVVVSTMLLALSPKRSSLTRLEETSPSLRSERSMSRERSAASRSSTLTPQPMTYDEDSNSAVVER